MGTLSFMVMEIPNIVSYVELKVYSYILQPQSFAHGQLLFAKSLTYPNGKTHQCKTKPEEP